MNSDCIFCKIVQGQIPCSRIYQNEHVLAFLDINPWSQGHSLLIPKAHHNRIDQCPPEVIAQVAKMLGPVARAVTKAVQADSYNILNNNGPDSGQLVEHLHFHIIPRTPGDGIIRHAPQGQYPPGKIDQLAQQIQKLL